MKRRDKFIETERRMKVMKTWLMKNVTIMSNVFIKVRLRQFGVRDSYAIGKHKIFVQSIAMYVQCSCVDDGALHLCLARLSLALCVTIKTCNGCAFISQHCIYTSSRDKRCKHISSSQPYVFYCWHFPYMRWYFFVLYRGCWKDASRLLWIIMHGPLLVTLYL